MWSQLLDTILKTEFLFSVIRITAPILFAALGAVIAEKAGVTNIGLEGIMMISALFGVLFSYWTQSWLVGVLGAMCGMIGSWAAMEAIRLLTGFGEDQAGKLHILDGTKPVMRTITLPKDPGCSSCGTG